MKTAVRHAMEFLTEDVGHGRRRWPTPTCQCGVGLPCSQVVDRTTGVHALIRKATSDAAGTDPHPPTEQPLGERPAVRDDGRAMPLLERLPRPPVIPTRTCSSTPSRPGSGTGDDALPGAGGGADRDRLRQQRDPLHAHRHRQEPGRPGAHFAALARGQRTFYTAPIKALVSEKFFALIRCSVPRTSACSPATPPSTRRRRSSAAPRRSSPTSPSVKGRPPTSARS